MNLPLNLDLEFPDGRGVDFPAPVKPLDAYCAWLGEMHQDRVRRGVLDQIAADLARRLPEVRFVWIE